MCKTIAALTNTASSTESTTPSMALHVVSNIVKEHSQAKESTNTLTQQLEEVYNQLLSVKLNLPLCMQEAGSNRDRLIYNIYVQYCSQ